MNYDSLSIKIFAVIAILLSSLGLLFSLYYLAFMSTISFAMLCWGSIIGLQLSNYNLDNDERKKVFFTLVVIIGVSLVAFLFGRIIGFFAALVTLASTYGIKKNYDDWNDRFPNEEEDIEDHLI